jgi:hypothetical protein
VVCVCVCVCVTTAYPTNTHQTKQKQNKPNTKHTGARALLHALKAHAEVDTLFLGQNQIGGKGAECLAQYLASSPPRLRSLSISDNPITDEGAHNIVGALPACASLATLSYVVGGGVWGPNAVMIDGGRRRLIRDEGRITLFLFSSLSLSL